MCLIFKHSLKNAITREVEGWGMSRHIFFFNKQSDKKSFFCSLSTLIWIIIFRQCLSMLRHTTQLSEVGTYYTWYAYSWTFLLLLLTRVQFGVCCEQFRSVLKKMNFRKVSFKVSLNFRATSLLIKTLEHYKKLLVLEQT